MHITFKTANRIVQEGVSLVIGETLSRDFQLFDENLENTLLYRTLINQAVEKVLQDYFTNFPFYLQKSQLIGSKPSEINGILHYMIPSGLYRILSIRDSVTKEIIKKEKDLFHFYDSKDACYYYDLCNGLMGNNTAEELLLIYISRAVFKELISEYDVLQSGNNIIMLDSYLLTYAFCKDLCIMKSVPAPKGEYFNNEYNRRLNYLITEGNYEPNTVFDLSTKKRRIIKL